MGECPICKGMKYVEVPTGIIDSNSGIEETIKDPCECQLIYELYPVGADLIPDEVKYNIWITKRMNIRKHLR